MRAPLIEPMLGLISRSVESTLGFLELHHLRVLILLGRKHATTVAELSALMNTCERRMFAILDAMEAAGWLTSGSQAIGVGEAIAISQQGRNVVDSVTLRRQHEIDAILGRLSEGERAELALAFNSFASAAGETPVRTHDTPIAP